jgi:hypothetical protein
VKDVRTLLSSAKNSAAGTGTTGSGTGSSGSGVASTGSTAKGLINSVLNGL